jgi:hypothetical protein
MPFSKKVCGCLSRHHCRKVNFIVDFKSFSSSDLFGWTEQVKSTWCLVRTMGSIWPYLPMYFLHVPVVTAVMHGCASLWRGQMLLTDLTALNERLTLWSLRSFE